MQAIKPYTQIFDDINNDVDILKKIELCGRVCYKSEGKITEGSAEKFVAGIVKRGHEAVLEHASFIFKISDDLLEEFQSAICDLEKWSDYKSFLRFTSGSEAIVSGNVRAWRDFLKVFNEHAKGIPSFMKNFIHENPILFPEFQEGNFIDVRFGNEFIQIKPTDLETELEKLVHWDVTVKFVIDRGISHEVVRHRPSSYCQESTRYCNYARDDFGNEITVIIPPYIAYKSAAWKVWKDSMKHAEEDYFKLLDIGLTAQEARGVLPTNLKTELVMTANLSEWKKFFILRTTNAAHPQMVEVARPLLDNMKEFIPDVFDCITYKPKGGENNGKKK